MARDFAQEAKDYLNNRTVIGKTKLNINDINNASKDLLVNITGDDFTSVSKEFTNILLDNTESDYVNHIILLALTATSVQRKRLTQKFAELLSRSQGLASVMDKYYTLNGKLNSTKLQLLGTVLLHSDKFESLILVQEIHKKTRSKSFYDCNLDNIRLNDERRDILEEFQKRYNKVDLASAVSLIKEAFTD